MSATGLLLAVLAACDLDGECDSGDCAGGGSDNPYGGVVDIAQVGWSCCQPPEHDGCVAGGLYWYDMVTDGRAEAVTLSIVDGTGGGHQETHQLPVFAADPDGWWEDRYLELPIADTTGCRTLADCEDRQKANQNTLFPCTDAYLEGRLTWTVRLYATDAESMTDCVTWGADAASVAASEGCSIATSPGA